MQRAWIMKEKGDNWTSLEFKTSPEKVTLRKWIGMAQKTRMKLGICVYLYVYVQPSKKWETYLNRSFTYWGIQMANIHMWVCSLSLTIRERQIKSSIPYDFIWYPFRMIKIRKLILIEVGRDMEQLACSCTMFKNSKRSTHFRKDPGNFSTIKWMYIYNVHSSNSRNSSNSTFREFIQERGKYVNLQNVGLLIHGSVTYSSQKLEVILVYQQV